MVEEDDVAAQLVLLRIEGFVSQLRKVDDLALDAAFGSGGAPAEGVDVERLEARLENLAGSGDFGLPECRHGEGLGVDVGEAEGFELIDCPGDGVDVVVGAGEAWSDVVGELAVVVVGLAADHDVADDLADGGAGLGRHRSLRKRAGNESGGEKKARGKTHSRTVSQRWAQSGLR